MINKIRAWEKIFDNEGWATINGIGLGRVLYLFELEIKDDKVKNRFNDFEGYNWGYTGKQVEHTAWAILEHLFDVEVADEFYEAFALQILRAFPQENFKLQLNIWRWIKDVKINSLKAIRSYILICASEDEDIWITKLLDFPNGNFSLGVFSNKTLEYQELSQIKKEKKFLGLNLYYESATRHRDKNNDTKWMVVQYDSEQDCFFCKNGMKSGTFEGTPMGVID
jgi:hypothetical protein